MAAAHRALDRAVDTAVALQRNDGSWMELPDARIFDTALVAIALSRARIAPPEPIAKAQSWLRQAAPQRHDADVHDVEAWLRDCALASGSAPSRSLPTGLNPTRSLLFAAMAEVPAAELISQVAELRAAAQGRRLKQWHQAIIDSVEIIALTRCRRPTPSSLVDRLEEALCLDGSLCNMTAVTALCLLAFSQLPDPPPAARRCLEYLLGQQRDDGTWRYIPLEVWDTTLMVRALRRHPQFSRDALEPAFDFIAGAQSPDGGWGAMQGLESDNDTTGSALIALAETAHSRQVWPAAERFALRTQRPDGLWTAWQSADDTIVEPDVVAHVVTGLTAHATTIVDTTPALTWLARQTEGNTGWYTPFSYATAEISTALGPAAPRSRHAYSQLLEQQNTDGGWPALAGQSNSSPAATGLALATIARLPQDLDTERVIRRSLAFLIDTQLADGTWPGTPILAGPRPFLTHYPVQTHAFVTTGLATLADRAGMRERE
ncbi:hypothetical protein [Streptomyces sparsus]